VTLLSFRVVVTCEEEYCGAIYECSGDILYQIRDCYYACFICKRGRCRIFLDSFKNLYFVAIPVVYISVDVSGD
jgi:hypothetical protein